MATDTIYFVEDCETQEKKQLTRKQMRRKLGPKLFEVLMESGSLSSGTDIYYYECANPAPDFDEFGSK